MGTIFIEMQRQINRGSILYIKEKNRYKKLLFKLELITNTKESHKHTQTHIDVTVVVIDY